jgi:hypothetical protein
MFGSNGWSKQALLISVVGGPEVEGLNRSGAVSIRGVDLSGSAGDLERGPKKERSEDLSVGLTWCWVSGMR